MCLYRYLEPLLYYLRLCHNEIKTTSTSTFKPRARALQLIEEFFSDPCSTTFRTAGARFST